MLARGKKCGTILALSSCWMLCAGPGACKSGGDATIGPTAEDARPSPATTAQNVATKHLAFVDAPSEGDVASIVRDEIARAKATGARPIVYVGAAWCEPCRRFHDAAEAGSLDAELPSIRFVAFDLDHDKERLASAGYTTAWIPLFVVPDDDGRATARKIAGSIKGPGAPSDILARLRQILD